MTAQDARPSWINRHKAVFALLALVAILLGAVGGWAVYLNQQLSNVPRIDLNLNEDKRPDKPTGSAARAVNILIAGADAGDGPSIADNLEAGEWDPGSHRSDTIMILHVTADRDSAYLISVPRDSWVFIPGYGMNKVNAAFSFGGPSLYVETIEDLTGLRMDHLAIIDWNGFKSLTNALGGVEIYVPESGSRMLDGEDALRYVRTRYGLENGDFDRIKRQQNFMRAVMEKLLSQGTVSNPFKLTNALEALPAPQLHAAHGPNVHAEAWSTVRTVHLRCAGGRKRVSQQCAERRAEPRPPYLLSGCHCCRSSVARRGLNHGRLPAKHRTHRALASRWTPAIRRGGSGLELGR